MRLIDADKLTELCDIMADKCDGIGEGVWHQFRITVEWSPTVDAVPVVRCKDCALCSIGSNDAEQWCWCIHWSKDTDPTGYCFCGRRRDGADNDQN